MKKIFSFFLILIISGSLFSQSKEPNVTKQAEFPGGEAALMQFIVDNIDYPIEALNKNITGMPYIRFMITKDGSVDSVQVLKSANPILDAEAIRLISMLPNWLPGEIDYEPADIWFVMPIKFSIEDSRYPSSSSDLIDNTGKYVSFDNAINHLSDVVELRVGSGSVKEIPNNIDTFPNLELLDYSGSQINKLPENFKNLDKVKSLDLSGCLFTEFPLEICDMESLEELDFAFNKITKIPIEILNCKNLKSINLEYTSIPKEEQKALKKQLKGIKLKF
jgi:TonB family protein